MTPHSPSHNSKRFFLTMHRYATTHPPHPPPQTTTTTSHHLPHPTTHPISTAPPPHYALFPLTLPHGPPPRGPFAIDPRRLRSEYLHLQQHAHPDQHPRGDKTRAEGASALINEAYRTLQSPLQRAQYLLQQRGVDVERMKLGGGDGDEDEELLTQVLEVREGIEAAGEEGQLAGMKGENEGRIGESEGVLEGAFGRDDLEGAKREVVRLRYWMGIKEALDAWEKGKPVVLGH